MTHQNHQTNGASLEDCHTNFFALTDLCGIKWRKLVLGERPNASGDPLDDPVLRSYSKCLAVDILCVWRRVAAPKPDPDPSGGYPFDMPLPGPGSGGSVTHPALSLTAAKELWIFWYGEEPDLSDLVAPELLKSSEGAEQGSWESGLSYECRSLLFKALHNLIERCLLSRDVVRLGRWFVQPSLNSEHVSGKSSVHLSFSFAFFVHGDSTVCASMDIREHPAVHPLTNEYLLEALAAQQNAELRPKPVILAPYGLSATLTGQGYKTIDPQKQKVLDDWSAFYPLCNRETTDVPPIVEVISGGVKMRYPSKYVLVTELDEIDSNCDTTTSNNSNNNSNNNNIIHMTNSSTVKNNDSNNNHNDSNNNNNSKTIAVKGKKSLSAPLTVPESPANDLGNPARMSISQTAASILPERVWQDCIMNSSLSLCLKQQQNCNDNSQNGTTSGTSLNNSESMWDFTDPTAKVSCVCIKCRKMSGRSGTSGSKSSSRSDKSSRIARIPFHKRPQQEPVGALFSAVPAITTTVSSTASTAAAPTTATSTSSPSTTTTTIATTSTTTNMKNSPSTPSCSSNSNNESVNNVSLPSTNQRSTGNTTPYGGPPSYSRNPLSISDSLAIPSIDSPASATASPLQLPNSAHSQPTSVPPADQLLSPHQPASVNPRSNQPATPSLDHLDKNTPAPTPTDQHDIKSVSSPYGQNPGGIASVEPPSSSQSSQQQQKSSNQSAATALSNTSSTMTNDQKNLIKKIEPSNSNNSLSNNNNVMNSKNNSNYNNSVNNLITLLKRPILSSKDYENLADDDYSIKTLYDYTTLNAWMNYPVKRFKPNNDAHIKQQQTSKNADLYADQNKKVEYLSQLSSQSTKSNASDSSIVKMENCAGISDSSETQLMDPIEIKKEPVENNVEPILNKDGKIENLFTSEGLQASYKDLDQIFDNSDDASSDEAVMLQVHTPPGSNKSMGCMDDLKRSSNNSNTSILRPEELSQMFPTPPSLEHHPNSSPAQGLCDTMLPNEIIEANPNLGSPLCEPIEDWSYVYNPPPTCKFYGSSKYAPLPAHALQPSIVLPKICLYKPSWLQNNNNNNSNSNNNNNGNNSNNNNTNNNSGNNNSNNSVDNSNSNNNSSNNVVNNVKIKKEVMDESVSQPLLIPPPLTTPNSVPPPNPLSRPSSAISLPGGGSMMNMNPNSNNSNSNMNMNMMNMGMMPNNMFGMPPNNSMGLRPGMSPISPATSVMGGMGSPMNMNNIYHRSQIPPPPPYDMAIASPATSTSSYLNKQFNSVEQPATPYSTAINRTPEANALLVNVLLYDTSLNIFRDHNFNSCTLCVCNAGNKCVGNIRGADSGVYLSLPGTTFHQISSSNTGGQFNNQNSYNNYGMLDSPMGQNQNQQPNGYVDEDPINCSCGFSAVINRRLAHCAGLFYEDEMDITGLAEDPVCYKKGSILKNEVAKIKTENDIKQECIDGANPSGGSSNSGNGGGGSGGNGCDNNNLTIPLAIMNLLREQCVIIQSSSSSIQRAIKRFRNFQATLQNSFKLGTLNLLEFSDAHEIISLAMEHSKFVFEVNNQQNSQNNQNQNNQLSHQLHQHHSNSFRSLSTLLSSCNNNINNLRNIVSVHKWPYIRAGGPRSNQDIVRIMKSMQPLLQDAFHKKCTTRLWDAPYTIQGPLTWRQFHRLAGRGTGQCEPQPIPSVIVGHDKDWLSVSPYALQYWDKLMLEPYSYARDIAYVIVSPDNDYVISRVETFFKELSTTYEMCKLGRHTPIKGWNGILRVGKSSRSSETLNDESYPVLGDSKTNDLLRSYVQACQNHLVPYLSKIPSDKTLLDPPDYSNGTNKDRPLPSPMPPPSTPDPSQPGDRAPSTPKSENDFDNQRDSLNTSTSSTPSSDPFKHDKDENKNPPHIVLYLVEPFTCGSDSPELQRVACLSLLRCYSNIIATVPESVKSNISVQIISQESILELGRTRDRMRWSDHMRCLSLSVFSQSRRFLAHTNNIKSLTGFGTAANAEHFLKNKDEKNRTPYKLYTPPYILSAQHEKSESNETFGQASVEQQCSVMYCSYCLSEDQSWLLAVATDGRGEILETVTINIDIPNRTRRKKASARRFGLQKLMDFILGVISQSVQPWRLVVGRIGRIGHGELKGWSWLLSKQNLLKASKHLKDICEQCSLMYPHAVPSILSACLVTLEPDSNLRVMPDQFTPDERFSQISMQSPLSTPQDVTCTHILVFPTSAITQSSHTAFNEQHINGLELGDDLFTLEDGEGVDEMEGINGLGDIFGEWDGDVQMPASSPTRDSRHGSPTEDNRDHQSPGPGGNCGQSRNGHLMQDSEEVGQLLQQPLALGYLVSTAPTGRMPSWFWSSCPHLENVCPVFLRTALHLHSPAIHQNTDDLLQQNQSSATDHPLDSQFTADVLRYVLEGYNVLSWLAMDSNTHDRLSCLPIHVQVLMQLYHMTAALA